MTEPLNRAVAQLARDVLAELDLDEVLRRLLSSAQELTDSEYAALGVLDEERKELARFITLGIDKDEEARIGPLPRGRGVLGELIRNPVPLRLAEIGAHPHSYGFPAPHPRMHTFLGVPIFVGGEPFGNLYLTEKAGGEEFTEDDEGAVVLLAEFAGLAIDHARRYERAADRGERLQRAVDALDATVAIARTLATQTDLETILDLVAKRGRALVAARGLVIELEESGAMVVTATAGEVPVDLVGKRIDTEGSLAGLALRTATTQRLDNDANRARYHGFGLGRHGLEAEAGMVVPLMLRGRSYGALVAVDRVEDGPGFSEHDQELLEAFAASAAIAVATAKLVRAEHDRQRVESVDAERARWTGELRDGPLRGLAAARTALLAIAEADPAQAQELVEGVGRRLEAEIASLRDIVTDLPDLDSIGIVAALESLADRARRRGLRVELSIETWLERGRPDERLEPELQSAILGVVAEGLANVAAHARARVATVDLHEAENEVRIAVVDDGDGFDPGVGEGGSGIRAMYERVERLGGKLEIGSSPGRGTQLRAVLPMRHAQQEAGGLQTA